MGGSYGRAGRARRATCLLRNVATQLQLCLELLVLELVELAAYLQQGSEVRRAWRGG